MHPWVAQQRERVGFALQVDTLNDDPAPTERVLAAGRLAEELGFDAFLTGDHPTWAPEVWLHMAALAVSTQRMRLGPMVSSILYRPPVLTARLAADLDRTGDPGFGPEPFSFRGRDDTATDAQVVPPPLQGAPPIVIAGASEKVTLRQVARCVAWLRRSRPCGSP
jgi:alkanesulfonate monooxygenase SsuD/methylene tetrahydromethanopterin reductase-like flavin-dependent oxidoreductase (luciferase family)